MEERSNVSGLDWPQKALIQEMFSIFKSYLNDKLKEKGKELQSKSERDRLVRKLKY